MNRKRVAALAGAAVAVAAAAAGYVVSTYVPGTVDSRVVERDDDHGVLELHDKRRVLLAYAPHRGLVERRTAKPGGRWPARRTITRRGRGTARASARERTAARSR